jgi:hypothetical protein
MGLAVFMTSVIETEGVGTAFAGTATGITMLFPVAIACTAGEQPGGY